MAKYSRTGHHLSVKWSSMVWLGVTDEQMICQSWMCEKSKSTTFSNYKMVESGLTRCDWWTKDLSISKTRSPMTNQLLSMSPIVKQQIKILDDLLFSKCKSRLLTSSNFNPDVLLHIPFFLPVFVHWISAMQLQKCECVEETSYWQCHQFSNTNDLLLFMHWISAM